MSESNNITRRQFVKRAALIGAAAVGGTAVVTGGKTVFDEMSRDETLAERNRARPRDTQHWLIPAERELVGALAAVIVPSDAKEPGATEAGVIDSLDRVLASSPGRQDLYAPGLLGFDELALSQRERTFAELSEAEQLRLFQLVDGIYRRGTTGGPGVTERARRVGTRLYHRWPAPGAWDGLGAVLQLFPQIIEDVKEAFYTSPVGWDWLGYDGPPFPRGYYGRVKCSPTGEQGRD